MVETYDNVIEQIAQSVFGTMLNIELVRVEDPPPLEHDLILATIHIAGKWTGSVVLALTPAAAREAAAGMLGVPEAEVSAVDQEDVASELANMIGGNLKSMLPGPSYLSLPTVFSGHEVGWQVHDAELIDDIALATQSGLLRTRLYAKRSDSVSLHH